MHGQEEILTNKWVGNRDVNRLGRVRVVTSMYPTCWINICPRTRIYIRQVSVRRVLAYIFNINGYPQVPTIIYKKIKKIFNNIF